MVTLYSQTLCVRKQLKNVCWRHYQLEIIHTRMTQIGWAFSVFGPLLTESLLHKGRLQNPIAGLLVVPSGSSWLSLLRTIETGQNRNKPLVNWQLGFEVVPKRRTFDFAITIWIVHWRTCIVCYFYASIKWMDMNPQSRDTAVLLQGHHSNGVVGLLVIRWSWGLIR